ncbi:MAG: type II toxin-antitoxin system VapC family toxin [Planctomycetia bacterium]|jgi:predicted nucleic acid-binding protein|nr:type II toxin-antitoxin system VapC family toxin [Planctomycetia bacterium]
MIVADTNVILYLMLPGDFTGAAEALYERDQEWVAPVLWRSEFRNALALYLRKKLLTLEEAFEIQSEAEVVISGNEYYIDSPDVLRLAAEIGQAAYDCEFVSLAQRLGIRLVTTDKKVLRAFPAIAISLTEAAG